MLSGGASVKNGLKFDGEKIDLSLMPPEWIYAFSELFAAGMTNGFCSLLPELVWVPREEIEMGGSA
mgnify:CR=1 FL=1